MSADLARIDALLAAGHPDSARIGISLGLLRQLSEDARLGREAASLQTAAAMRSANATIATVTEQMLRRIPA